jgi:hypothetical protein
MVILMPSYQMKRSLFITGNIFRKYLLQIEASFVLLSRVSVTKDGIRIGNWIYWPSLVITAISS